MMDKVELKEALKELIGWIPDYRKPSDFAEMAGYPIEQVTQEDDGANFVSEAFLYIVLGKEDARSLLLRLRRVCKAAGFEMYDLEREIAREKENERKRICGY